MVLAFLVYLVMGYRTPNLNFCRRDYIAARREGGRVPYIMWPFCSVSCGLSGVLGLGRRKEMPGGDFCGNRSDAA